MKSFIITYPGNDRIDETLLHLKSEGHLPQVIEVVQGFLPYVNVLKTVQNIISDHVNDENILIFEDDVRLYKNFDPDELARKAKGRFTTICTGSFSTEHVYKSDIEGLLYCITYHGAQAVIYNKKIYPLILRANDIYIDAQSKYWPDTMLTYPFLTYQKDYDDINKDGDLVRREHLFKLTEHKIKRLIELKAIY
ncbi:hypothetical protein [Pedobacter sp. UBA5917]|uniref:hypothetical protein n=1 Tax=Pedobacter sp. UBA5917 TaxID=1947061 RepID=UPI0025EB431A|nr:hypothetical protein [Pedobacter sp. UBA5917]